MKYVRGVLYNADRCVSFNIVIFAAKTQLFLFLLPCLGQIREKRLKWFPKEGSWEKPRIIEACPRTVWSSESVGLSIYSKGFARIRVISQILHHHRTRCALVVV